MAEPITIQKLLDASIDSDTFEVAVNGDAQTDVTARLGATYPSVQKAIRLMTETGISFTPFETKAQMTASAKADGTYAVVTNDTVANIGVYLKKSGAWALVTWNNFTNLDSLKINSGKAYPFKQLVRDGIESTAWAGDLDFVIDASVINAKEGFYYAVRFFRNGLVDTSSRDPYAWNITRYPKGTYATASVETSIITTYDSAPSIPRGEIQTVFLKSPTSDEIIKLTVDTTKLKPEGETYSWNTETRPMWSWIIDENCYVIKAEDTPEPIDPAKSVSTLHAELADGVLSFYYPSGDNDYRITVKPNGYNALPNVFKIEKRLSATTDWTEISSTDTDWLPPLGAQVDNGDAEFVSLTTGGNHGQNGAAGGGQTARNIYYSIEINGKKEVAYSGFVSGIKVTIINEVMAMNSVANNRYAIRECFVLDINERGVIDVKCDRRALEPLTMSKDRGLQAVINAFQDTYLVLDGEVETRATTVSNAGSGTKLAAPNAHAIIFHSTAGDQITMAIDRGYGLGDTSHVSTSQPLFFMTMGAVTKKAYSSIIASLSLHLEAGQGYQWRGSYQIKSVSDKPLLSDSQIDTTNSRIIAYTSKDYMTV